MNIINFITSFIEIAIISQPNVELKVFKVVLSLITTWTVAWTPYATVALIGIFSYGHLLTVNTSI